FPSFLRQRKPLQLLLIHLLPVLHLLSEPIMTDLTAASTLSVQRVRHPLKSRLVQVKRVEHVQPGFVRVTFGGDELEGFLSASFDDHMKMFFPANPDAKPVKPEIGEKGMIFPEGVERPVARDYTPLHFDAEKRELEVDF